VASVCVYCSSSDAIDDRYPPVADALGRGLARRGHTLVYGGGSVGLMGTVARGVHAEGGRVVGVIPASLREREGIAYELADELVVTQSLHERKKKMVARADAFAILPGGFGTLEEFLEVLTLKQLGNHQRPIVLVNTDGFFDPLLAFFRRLYDDRFARASAETLVDVVPAPDDALAALDDGLPARPADEPGDPAGPEPPGNAPSGDAGSANA
jgi:hypothetical protein